MKDKGSDDIRNDFLAEAMSLLEQLKKGMAKLDQFKEGDKLDFDLLSALRRYVHTIKGISGMYGFADLQKLSKTSQEFFDHLLQCRLKLNWQCLALIKQCVVKIAECIEEEKKEIVNIEELIASFEDYMKKELLADNETERAKAFLELKLDQKIIDALLTVEECRLFERIKSGSGVYLAFSSIKLCEFEEQFHQFQAYLANVGEVIATLPSTETSTGDAMKFIAVLASKLSISEIAESLVETEIDIEQFKEPIDDDVFFDNDIAEGF